MKMKKLYVITPLETFKQKIRELSLIVNEIESLTPNVISYKSNFTQEKYSALQSWKGNQDIVFKTAYYFQDKIVKEHLLSNVYKDVFVDSDKKVFKSVMKNVIK